jgi:tRNA 2-selenouridine synthase
MDMIGYKTFLLEGGYKTFRAKVNEYINNESLPEFYVLYGPSGTGKTELLARLKNDSFGVLELEKYANHKGSLLGAEKEAQPSQKLFETNLAIAMLLNDSKPFWILEGESVKIGKLSIPQRIYKKMRAARKIWIELPLDVRASRIAIDYTAPDEELIHKLGYLKQYMGSETIQEIISHVKNKDRKQAAFMLLEKHYDHYYQRNFNPEMPDSNFVKTIREDDIEVIYTSLKDFLKQQN